MWTFLNLLAECGLASSQGLPPRITLSLPAWSFWPGSPLELPEMWGGCKSLQRCWWSSLPRRAMQPLPSWIVSCQCQCYRQAGHEGQQVFFLLSETSIHPLLLCSFPGPGESLFSLSEINFPFLLFKALSPSLESLFPKGHRLLEHTSQKQFQVIYFLLCLNLCWISNMQDSLLAWIREGRVNILKYYKSSA